MKRVPSILLVLTLCVIGPVKAASEPAVSLALMPKGLTTGQAAEWILEHSCYRFVVLSQHDSGSAHIANSPVDYSRLQYRDLVSLDTALLLISPRQSKLVIDNESMQISYRY